MIKHSLWAMVASFMLVSLAHAAPQVAVSITAEKEIVLFEKGKKITKRVKATDVVSGDVIYYTLNVVNKGDEKAEKVALVDPIPDNTIYQNGSAYGSGSVISFSIDDGKHYQKPSLLTYLLNGKKEQASPDRYTHIQWVVGALPQGASSMLGFQVKVK